MDDYNYYTSGESADESCTEDRIDELQDIKKRMENDIIKIWHNVIKKYVDGSDCKIMDRLYLQDHEEFLEFVKSNSDSFKKIDSSIDYLVN